MKNNYSNGETTNTGTWRGDEGVEERWLDRMETDSIAEEAKHCFLHKCVTVIVIY